VENSISSLPCAQGGTKAYSGLTTFPFNNKTCLHVLKCLLPRKLQISSLFSLAIIERVGEAQDVLFQSVDAVVSPDVDRCRQRLPVDVADAPNGGGAGLRLQQQPIREMEIVDAAMASRIPMTGYLSNYVTELTGCGNVDSPWRITALRGQQINVTLFDFGDGTASAGTGGTSAMSGTGAGLAAGTGLQTLTAVPRASATAAGSAHGAFVCQVSAFVNLAQKSGTENC
jgi:hypothetical protein